MSTNNFKEVYIQMGRENKVIVFKSFSHKPDIIGFREELIRNSVPLEHLKMWSDKFSSYVDIQDRDLENIRDGERFLVKYPGDERYDYAEDYYPSGRNGYYDFREEYGYRYPSNCDNFFGQNPSREDLVYAIDRAVGEIVGEYGDGGFYSGIRGVSHRGNRGRRPRRR